MMKIPFISILITTGFCANLFGQNLNNLFYYDKIKSQEETVRIKLNLPVEN